MPCLGLRTGLMLTRETANSAYCPEQTHPELRRLECAEKLYTGAGFFMRLLASIVLLLFGLASSAAAQSTRVGIMPFDVVSIDNAGQSASEALAKLVRIEMIKARKTTPELISLGESTSMPIEEARAAELGKTAKVALVIVGTVTEAELTESTKSASTGGFLSSIGIGGNISRATATVSVHVDLVDPDAGKVVESFEVDAKNTDTGLGMDFSTSLGSMDSGGGGLDKSPMGKALQAVAKKLSDEVNKRAPKLVRK